MTKCLQSLHEDHSLLFFFFKFIYFEGGRGEGWGRDRESHTISTEPDARLEPTNREIMT